jgi:hypothetical protein
MEVNMRTAREVWQSVTRMWVVYVVHVVYPSLGVVGFIWGGAKAGANDPRVLASYIALCVYVLLLMATTAYIAAKFSRKARYAQATSCIHAAIHRLRDANWYLERCISGEVSYEKAHLQKLLQPCLGSVAKAFTLVSSSTNRACIKVLGGKKRAARNCARPHILPRLGVSG